MEREKSSLSGTFFGFSQFFTSHFCNFHLYRPSSAGRGRHARKSAIVLFSKIKFSDLAAF